MQRTPVPCSVLARVHGHLSSPSIGQAAGTPAPVPPASVTIERLHPDFGAKLHNVDLANISKMSEAEWSVIQDTFDEYGVVIIPGQENLSPKALSEFARRLHRPDPVEIGLPEDCGPQHLLSQFGKKPQQTGGGGGWGKVPGHSEIGILGVNAEPMGLKDSTAIGIEWHIDSAPGGGHIRKTLKDGTKVKSTLTLGCATVIYSVVAPEEGGETLFAHGGVMYDLLAPEMQRKAEQTTVRYRSRVGKLEDAVMGNGGTKIVDDDKITTRLPLVRTHPQTGRKCIWATPRFMESCEGLSVEASRDLVSECMQPGTDPSHVYVHKYTVGDVVCWDDRHCFHSTSPIKEKENRYHTGGVVGTRIIQRVSSAAAAAVKWGDSENKESSDSDDDDAAVPSKAAKQLQQTVARKVRK